MREIAELVGYFAVLFAAAMAVAWLLTTLRAGTGRAVVPAIGSCVRMRGPEGMYRTRLLEARGPFWILSAPLMRDYYVPLQVGEKLTVEVPLDDGVMFFRTVVRARDAQTHSVIVERPERGRKTERRSERRVVDLTGRPVQVEGVSSRLVNVSRSGARVTTERPVLMGERVQVEFPWLSEPTYGWVLEAVEGDHATFEARIRFEELLPSLPA